MRAQKRIAGAFKKSPWPGKKRREARGSSYIEVHPTAESELFRFTLEMEIFTAAAFYQIC